MAYGRYNPAPRLPLGTPSKRNPRNVVIAYHDGHNYYGPAATFGTTEKEIRASHVQGLTHAVIIGAVGVLLVAIAVMAFSAPFAGV